MRDGAEAGLEAAGNGVGVLHRRGDAWDVLEDIPKRLRGRGCC
jgi:hypothetical protein